VWRVHTNSVETENVTTNRGRGRDMAIKKGDRLILNDQGRERLVVAFGPEIDGMIDIIDNGVTTCISIYDVRPADDDSGKKQGQGQSN
jgi:hypothetical protein